ncbi:hypothetical protein [Clostridium sp. UBA1652]|uniref:hypothetical protein n=1 Tax=Clostridium sp. UBA1652 TaxID=1946348 RepID=UPI00257ADD3F|nr:hypothetical protein [Clostridium sp. UBA1652]
MKDKINTYVKRIDLINISNENLVNEILQFISSLLARDIADNQEELGILFYRSVSRLNQDNCSPETEKNIIDAFDNIGTMSVENQSISELKTIYFLQRIYSKNSNNIIELPKESIKSEFLNLLENLEQIRILFKIKSKDITIFPISNLLFDVIKCDNLLDELNYIKILQTLMLALQIFNSNEYTEEFDCIKSIIDDSELTFASYLLEYSIRIGGKDWIRNYEKNGVLILYNPNRKKVLIRNIKIEYFKLIGKEYLNISEIKTEKNHNKEAIAYYIEYDLNSLVSVDIFEEFKKSNNFERIFEILKIVINERYYNILIKDSLIVSNGKIMPINPFSNEDKYSIYRDNDVIPSFDNIMPCFNSFSLNKIVGDGIDYINLGILFSLQKIEMVNLQKLDLENSELRFNTLLKNWLTECTDKEKSFNNFLKIYTEQLAYVEDKNKFLQKEYEGEYFIPYQLDEEIINILDFSDYITKENIIKCIYEEDFFSGEKKIIRTDTGQDITFYKKICDDEKEQIKGEFSACINDEEKVLYVGEDIENYSRILHKIRDINKSMLSEELLELISEVHISELFSYMKMHVKAWSKIHPKATFDSIVRYRLANHLLLFNFDKSKFFNWFRLIKKHDIVDYSIISKSQFLDIDKKGVLYVLKDRSRSQSTFKYINYEYINSSTHRDKVDLFDPIVEKNDSGYYTINGELIKEVCFVFDVIQRAGATKCTLNYYLSHKSKQDDKHIQIYVLGKWVSINEIIQKNNATIVVYSIYASNEGEKNVNDYLKSSKYLYNLMIKDEEISSKLDPSDKSLIKDIYGKYSGEIEIDDFIVIREFNQPKHNIFHKELLVPERICSLFVKRKEI